MGPFRLRIAPLALPKAAPQFSGKTQAFCSPSVSEGPGRKRTDRQRFFLASPKTTAGKADAVKPRTRAVAKDKKERLSGLDAAAKVLAETGEAMRPAAMVQVMLQKGYWSTKGKTPAATIASAIIREIARRGKESRFREVAPGT